VFRGEGKAKGAKERGHEECEMPSKKQGGEKAKKGVEQALASELVQKKFNRGKWESLFI